MNNLSSLLLFIGQKLTGLQNQIYPVGSIYICTHNTNPGVLFGGTWQKIEGRFLLGSSPDYTVGNTGGSANAIVPYHNHSVAKVTNGITGGSHAHGLGERWSDGSGSLSAYTRSSNRKRTTINASASTHTHDLPAHNTNYAGTANNAVGANMPPYLVVNVWKRTE